MNWRGIALTLMATLLLEGAVLAAPYTVQPGDTLYSLAKRFMTTPTALQVANQLTDTRLRVRQVLEIPERVHSVTKGETLYAIARLYNVPMAELRTLNSMSTDAVQIGQKLTIPWNASDLAPQGPNAVPPPVPLVPRGPKPPIPPPPRPPSSDPPISSPVPTPISSPVPPPALPISAPIAVPSPAPQPALSINDLPPLPSAAQIVMTPERPAPSLPNGPQAARAIPPLVMPFSPALPSISDAPAPTVVSRPASSNPVSSNPASNNPDAPTLIHTVQSGDTLFNIAKRYGLSLEQIKLENALETDSLALGQRLRIPAPLEVASAPQPSNLREIASRYLGVTYVYGGSSASGLDCSGFVSIVYRELGVSLPRTSREQFLTGVPVKQADLEPGDLVFFDTLGRGAVSHVGIYLGAGEFIHAASNPGKVIVSKLEERYYATRYLGARRVLPQD